MNRLISAVAAALMLGAAWAPRAGAQVNCLLNNIAACTAGGAASTAITITIQTVARLTSPSGALILSTPNATQFQTGFSAPLAVPLGVRANTSWALTIRGGAALWTAAPASAWQNKPVADLQWATVVGGPYTNMTTTLAPLASGSATASAAPPLFIRARFAWADDRPGNYSMPVQIVLTAP